MKVSYRSEMKMSAHLQSIKHAAVAAYEARHGCGTLFSDAALMFSECGGFSKAFPLVIPDVTHSKPNKIMEMMCKHFALASVNTLVSYHGNNASHV